MSEIVAPCGKRRSLNHRPFNRDSVHQHELSCPRCRAIADDVPDFELTSLIADDDMPDGAYFALADWLGEW